MRTYGRKRAWSPGSAWSFHRATAFPSSFPHRIPPLPHSEGSHNPSTSFRPGPLQSTLCSAQSERQVASSSVRLPTKQVYRPYSFLLWTPRRQSSKLSDPGICSCPLTYRTGTSTSPCTRIPRGSFDSFSKEKSFNFRPFPSASSPPRRYSPGSWQRWGSG